MTWTEPKIIVGPEKYELNYYDYQDAYDFAVENGTIK